MSSFVLVALLALIISVNPHFSLAGDPKVDICHKGKVLININSNALQAHLGHGDFVIDDTDLSTTNDTATCLTLKPFTLTVNKQFVGTTTVNASDFSFVVNNGAPVAFESDASNNVAVSAGTYSVTETQTANYTTSYSSNVAGHANDCTSLPVALTEATESTPVVCTVTNTLNAPETPKTCVFGSDPTTLVGTAPAVASFVHPLWNTSLVSASPLTQWIWNAFHATPSNTTDEIVTFTKTFNVVGTPSSVKLDLAADNYYSVSVNGTASCADQTNLNNFSVVEPTCDITGLVHTGVNTLTFVVNNKSGYGTDPEQNPGGLIYKVTIDGATCDAVPPAGPTYAKVHLYKYLSNGETEAQVPDTFTGPQFPMTATWDALNIGAGTGNYALGYGHGGAAFKWAADTSAMQEPVVHYTSSEVTGGDSPVVADSEQCAPGKYFLKGYRSGTSLSAAEAATLTSVAPDYTNFTGDRYVIVVNQACSSNTGSEPTNTSETVVVSGNTSAGENLLGWMFNRDTTTQTPFSFNTGAFSIGIGSLFVNPITNTVNGNNDKFIGELFLLTPISGLNSVSYDFKIAAPDASAKDQFYASVYANFGESSPTKYYDCRYSVVPTTGSTSGFTTVTFDPTQNYPVATRGTSPHPCPASPAGMQALSASGTSTIRVIALNVGDTSSSDTGVSGYLDKVVTSITTGLNTHTTTYDFEPADMCSNIEGTQVSVPEGMTASNGVCTTPTVETPTSTGRSGSHRHGGGSVLGAFTTGGQVLGESCGVYLEKFLRTGSKKNDADQTKKLQTFLNKWMGSNLPVTGFYGPLSTAAVKAFQTKYSDDILTPWGIKTPTGLVYYTTLHKVNELECPEAAGEKPTNLVEWSKNKNVQ